MSVSKMELINSANELRCAAGNPELLEVGRKVIEKVLLEFRDDRLSQMRGNGLVIKEFDGKPSDVIRMGPEDALRIGLRAMADYLEEG